MKTLINFNILGIGKAGCNIADSFKQYSQYRIYKIDIEKKKEKKYYQLLRQNNIIEYEKNIPDLSIFLRKVKNELLVIVGGSGNISGIVLRVLEQLKSKCKISILYIKPDISLLGELKYKQHEIIYHVLQEYTRSAVFKQMYIIDNKFLYDNAESSILSLEKKYTVINENITFCYHMINVFNNMSAIESNFEESLLTAKLITIGFCEFDNLFEGEKLFANIEEIREKKYYFAINQKTLSSGDMSFYKKIKDILKNSKISNKEAKISYGIFSTKFDNNLIFFEVRSSDIQN